MKPFDLELAKKGHPVCQRDGYPARIICFDMDDKETPIVALITTEYRGELPTCYTNEGMHCPSGMETDMDLFMREDIFCEKPKLNKYQKLVAELRGEDKKVW